MIDRFILNSVNSYLFKGRAIILYGPRRAGKTTFVKALSQNYKETSIYLNCDESDVRTLLEDANSQRLKKNIGNKKLLILDEAQRVKNIGLTIKLLVDEFPEVQVIATGSSSFDLSNTVKEPLTGRKFEFHLHPFSISEISQSMNALERKGMIDHLLIYGLYPEVFQSDHQFAEEILYELTESYLYKDIFTFQQIRKHDVFEKLLQALALQVGSEVSLNELSSLLGIDKNTVGSYIKLLEEGFIIFRLTSFSRNLRNELKKQYKIYFYDNGIRNALIRNLNPIHLRQDKGALWENFILSERMKYRAYTRNRHRAYFWRTHQQQEIDYLEETSEIINAYEIKYSQKKATLPKSFRENYECTFKVINRDNFEEFVGIGEETMVNQ